MSNFKHDDIKELNVQFSYGAHPDDPKKTAIRIDNGTFEGFIVSFNFMRPTFPEKEGDECYMSFSYDVISLAGDFTEEKVKEQYAEELNMVMSNIALVLLQDALAKVSE